MDTDDSWTTKSSSSGSRNSPLETVIDSNKPTGEVTNTQTVPDNALQGDIQDVQPSVVGDVFSQATGDVFSQATGDVFSQAVGDIVPRAGIDMFSQGGVDIISQPVGDVFSHAGGDMVSQASGDIFSQAGDSPFMVFDNTKDLKKDRSLEQTSDTMELSETVKSVLNGVGELTIDSEEVNGDVLPSVSKETEDDGDVDGGIREHGMILTEQEMVDC